MLYSKQFILGSIAVVVGSFAIGIIVFLVSSFDTVTAYQKDERATGVGSSTPVRPSVVVSEIEVAERAGEIEESRAVFELENEEAVVVAKEIKPQKDRTVSVPTVPFYSQFNDITPASWKKVGCGVASLAMLIEYYNPGSVVVDTLLQEGIDADAYLDSAGWTYAGLIGISRKYGMGGETHDYGNLSMEGAFKELEAELEEGPVMASVHYTFQKSNPIPHLVVVNGITDGKVYYNDPAEEKGGGSVSIAQFQEAWKKRYIEFRSL